MKYTKTVRRGILIGLIIGLVVIVVSGLDFLKCFGEFSDAESVKGYWASLREFEMKNGRFPTNDLEIADYFHDTLEQIRQEPVEYLAPQGTNEAQVVLWWKKKTLFGVRVGITKSGEIIKN